MHDPGLVSISFRDQTPEAILRACTEANLKFIEWGSDVHAPCHDIAQLEYIAALQKQYGISCCSYGTYFRLGHSPIEELPQYIHAAKILGTNILRLWAGRKKVSDCTPDERTAFIDQCRQAAAIAQEHDVILCLECHRRSYTETRDGALELMEAVHSPNFRMYWQPNPDISLADNLDYIAALNPYITHIHVFNWSGDQRYSLQEGLDTWKQYLSALSGDHHLLLEFMPDDRFQSLAGEAESLHDMIQLQTVQNT